MNENNSVCDERRLVAMLEDQLEAHEAAELFEHLATCKHCQDRSEELAASKSEWNDVVASLNTPADSPPIPSSFPIESPNDSIQWNDSMAKQLFSLPSHPEMLGRIGRYEIERLIGVGGMGIVFKAYDSELSRPVAIKILSPYLSGSATARKRFDREARAAAAVVHQHVVPIHNVETDRETPFLVMHYVAGESLQARIDREGPFELKEILRIGLQVASGLSAAHEQGLVHRDIKPSNILLEEANVERALITDFGLARAANDVQVTRTGAFMGTPQYMSPEQARGDRTDPQSDLFSLGSVLYALCTGCAPFQADTPFGIMWQISDTKPLPIRELNSDIPPWLCHIVDRLMAKEKRDRYESAHDVARLLKECLNHVQQPDSVPLPTEVTVRKAPRFSLITQLFIGATVLAVLAIFGYKSLPFKIAEIKSSTNNASFAVGKPETKANQPDSGDASDNTDTLTEVLGHGFVRKGESIFYNDFELNQLGLDTSKFNIMNGRRLEPAEHFDAASFKALNETYSKDRNHVYFRREVNVTARIREPRFYRILKADPNSFEVVAPTIAKDHQHVWSHAVALKDVDPRSFEVVGDGKAWKDANNVWYGLSMIEGADVASFQHVGNHYYRDRHSVYWASKPIDGADPLTFRLFQRELPYGRDRDSVWYQHTRMEGIDPASFDVIHPGLYRDQNGVYADGIKIPDANPASFHKLAEVYGKSNGLFSDGTNNFVYLSRLFGFYRVELRGTELTITWLIVDWNIPEPEIVDELTVVLGKEGWKASKEAEERFGQKLKLFRSHFEKVRSILSTKKKKASTPDKKPWDCVPHPIKKGNDNIVAVTPVS